MENGVLEALNERFEVEKESVEVPLGDISKRADCIARDRQTSERYVVEVKSGTSVDSFLQTTLYRSFVQLRAMARELDAKPMLVYVPEVITQNEVEKIHQQIRTFTPDLSFVMVDSDRDEIISLVLEGETIRSNVESKVNSRDKESIGEESKPLRFSDKELWMFKCWFYSQEEFQEHWNQEFEPIRNGNQLKEVSGVSLSECYRWVNAMEEQGYLREEGHGKKRLSRFREYLERWNERYRIQDNNSFSNMICSEPQDDQNTWEFLTGKLRSLSEKKRKDYVLTGVRSSSLYGNLFVNIDEVYLYRSHDNPQRMIDELGLFQANESVDTQIVTFKPKHKKAVFDGANVRKDLFVVDPLQLYLDCYHSKKRGLEQAETIRDKMLMPQSSVGY